LEPKVISDLIKENVELYRDENLYQNVLRQEKKEKDLLTDIAENFAGVSDNWQTIKEMYC